MTRRIAFGLLCVVAMLAAAVLVADAADTLRQFDRIAVGCAQSTGRVNLRAGTDATDGIYWGQDTVLYRSAANTLTTNDLFEVSKAATSATAVSDFAELTNTKNAASMTGTGAGLLWNQWYYDGTTPAVADAARISVYTEGNWTSTASTQDSTISFQTALNGTVSEQLKVDSAGTTTAAALAVTGAANLNGATTLGNAATDAITCTGRLGITQVTDAGPMTATNGTEGDLVYNLSNDKVYVCTATGTPGTWAALH
jgi:hypothetical protein